MYFVKNKYIYLVIVCLITIQAFVVLIVFSEGNTIWDCPIEDNNKIHRIIFIYICEISGSHSSEYEDSCLLGCCTV
jgi:hypothetical protein